MTKTPKGQIGLYSEKGRLKANFPRQYFPGQPQIKKGLQLADTPENRVKADLVIRTLQLELEKGNLWDENNHFNEDAFVDCLSSCSVLGVCVKNTLTKNKREREEEKREDREIKLIDIWNDYLLYIQPTIKESSFTRKFENTYSNALNFAINSTHSEDPVTIRNFLIANRSLAMVRRLISCLTKAYKLAIRQGKVTSNPWDGMTDDIAKLGEKGKKQNEIFDDDNDLLNQNKAYTWKEVSIILNHFSQPKFAAWYNFYKFKFLTGCRTGEAIALMWQDVDFDNQFIYIRRNYDRITKKFYSTKNNTVRRFPLRENSELWQLLKSIPQGEPNEVVLVGKQGKLILDSVASLAWRRQINHLIEQGRLTRYLPPYNTRHSFISHQIYDLNTPSEIVAQWCEHSEDISKRHYRDIGDRAINYNPDNGLCLEIIV